MKNINLELRSEVIEIALTIEHNIGKLIIIYLNIERDVTKTLGNKSSSLSFKNKVDLLHDLEIVEDEEHKELIFLMEFRNQFLHNLDCNSFVNAVATLGADRGKKLLKYDVTDIRTDLENSYRNAYRNLYKRCIGIILAKCAAKRAIIEEGRKMANDLLNYSVFAIDGFFDIYDKACEHFLPDVDIDERAEHITLKAEILGFMGDSIMELTASEAFKELKEKFHVAFDEKHIRRFFK